MKSLRGPDGGPSDPGDLVGSSGSAPASTPKERAPWPEAGSARGPLAWSDEELAAFIRDNHITFPGSTVESEPQPEARLEVLNEAIESGAIETVIEAIESGAIGREKPGRKPARPGYLVRARERLDEARGNFAGARENFIEQEMKSQSIQRKTAENRWAEAMKTLFPER